MFSESAQYYDLIYSQFKDYAAESKQIAELIRAEQPKARRILDVACGTGEHARLLEQEHGFQVDGLDVDATFVRIALKPLSDSRSRSNPMASSWLNRGSSPARGVRAVSLSIQACRRKSRSVA